MTLSDLEARARRGEATEADFYAAQAELDRLREVNFAAQRPAKRQARFTAMVQNYKQKMAAHWGLDCSLPEGDRAI